MGLEIDRESFGPAEFAAFDKRLADSVEALGAVLSRPGFGEGPTSIGAELELNLVSSGGRPFLSNREVLAGTLDPRVTLEANRFNLEINSSPFLIAGKPFTAIANELEGSIATIQRAATPHGARVVTVGILPTLREADLEPGVLTDGCRYRALSASLKRLRPEGFHVRIEGLDALDLRADDITLEGANTSFQVHLRVSPKDFARTYNAAQIATAPALALGCNSPTFLGRRLWDETRVALFRQSVDDRAGGAGGEEDDWRPARVSFGHGWVRLGARELFAESVAMHAPLLPVLAVEDPRARVRDGGVPGLAELRLHHGTVWRWNRAVYDDACGGHLRVELRALPAGPTVIDMMATAAFVLGLTLGLAPDADDLTSALTFGQARRNFYEAARHGAEAKLLWPSASRPSPRERSVRELIADLLPIARRGLLVAGVVASEADALLAIIEARAASGLTGSAWQRRAREALGSDAAMLDRYMALSAEGAPVHTWPLAL